MCFRVQIKINAMCSTVNLCLENKHEINAVQGRLVLLSHLIRTTNPMDHEQSMIER